ncbi:hypothetical protein HN51_000551 [Arachis hypogaea]
MVISSSSYSQTSVTHQYDIFISHLHSALCRNRIETFIDYRIKKGGAIWNELVEAIRDSKLFLVIFSENYASSKWCLRELVQIMECKKKNENGTLFFPLENSGFMKSLTKSFYPKKKKSEPPFWDEFISYSFETSSYFWIGGSGLDIRSKARISLRRADASMWLMLINKLSKKSLLPVLFSTETFAMGVNAPARTSWKEDV